MYYDIFKCINHLYNIQAIFVAIDLIKSLKEINLANL